MSRSSRHDLQRLQIMPNLRALSLAEGARAALTTAALILLNEWANWPPLIEAALGANMACLCDSGGSVRRRVPALLVFAAFGGLFTAGYGLLRNLGLPIVVMVACIGLFCTAFIRAWGDSPMQVGNLLAVAQIFGLDHRYPPKEAFLLGGMFALGALWALLVTAVIWRIRPTLPARRALAEAFRQTALLCHDLRAVLLRPDAQPEHWDLHARSHRRAVRLAIEKARSTLMDTIQTRGSPGPRLEQGLIRLEALDQIFGNLIALAELLEGDTDPGLRAAADSMLRVLRPVLVVLGDAIRRGATIPPDRIDRAVAAISAAADAAPALRAMGESIADRLRIATTLAAPPGYVVDASGGTNVIPFWERQLAPLRNNLRWNSPIFRHALRTAVMSVPAIAIAQYHPSNYGHWLPMTMLLVLQPYYASTWQRALERIGGTVLGGILASVLGVVCVSPLRVAAAMFPLSMVAFTMRSTSYGLFMVGLTPQVVLLSEVGHGGTGWQIAGMRALYTVAGGVFAVIGGLLLWPSWEPDRLRGQLRTALLAHADFADAALGRVLNIVTPRETTQARRRAGLASNELETSLSRALQEPRSSMRRMLETLVVVDAGLRRLAGRLTLLRLDPSLVDVEELKLWRDWVPAALRALADQRHPEPRPAMCHADALARIARQIEMMDGALNPRAPLTEEASQVAAIAQ